MLLGDIQARVRIALTTTLTNEWSLFAPATGTSHPSERSIAFHLGWCLRPLIDESWDMDCDYQRSGMALESSVAFYHLKYSILLFIRLRYLSRTFILK